MAKRVPLTAVMTEARLAHHSVGVVVDLLTKATIWLAVAALAYLLAGALLALPTPLQGLVRPELRAASFLPALYQSAIDAIVIAGVCAFFWWAIAKAWKPASPREALRFQRVWWLLALVFTGLILGVFHYVVLKDAGPVTLAARAIFLLGYLLSSWGFFLVSVLALSPLSVASAIPGSAFVSQLKRS
ncbi:MAG: hypothetical protein ACREYF_13605 [Gammaproteobacteria bacterium]